MALSAKASKWLYHKLGIAPEVVEPKTDDYCRHCIYFIPPNVEYPLKVCQYRLTPNIVQLEGQFIVDGCPYLT